MSSNGVNKREDKPIAAKNIDRIDNLVVHEVEQALAGMDADIAELDSYISVIRDRMMTPDADPAHPLILARFAEIKLATRKQKNEALKTLISYKSEEHQSKRRSSDPASSISDIMAGVGLGAAMASNPYKLDISSTTPALINADNVNEIEVEPMDGYTPTVVEVDSMDDAVTRILGELDGNE